MLTLVHVGIVARINTVRHHGPSVIYFVDCVEYMAELLTLVQGLTEPQGRVLVLEGRSGMGKSALLGEFARQIGDDPSLSGLCRVASTRCYPQIGSGLTYAPAVDLLLQLHEQSEQRSWLQRVVRGAGRGVAKTAPVAVRHRMHQRRQLGPCWTAGRPKAWQRGAHWQDCLPTRLRN